jgi:hypothetical protein
VSPPFARSASFASSEVTVLLDVALYLLYNAGCKKVFRHDD